MKASTRFEGHKVSCIILVIKIFFCLRGGFTVRCPHRRPKYAIPERESHGNFALCRQPIMCAWVAATKPYWGCDCGTTYRRLVSGCETPQISNARCTTILTAGATIKNSFPWKNWFSFQSFVVECWSISRSIHNGPRVLVSATPHFIILNKMQFFLLQWILVNFLAITFIYKN